jgi:hypothetical protein
MRERWGEGEIERRSFIVFVLLLASTLIDYEIGLLQVGLHLVAVSSNPVVELWLPANKCDESGFGRLVS